MLEGALAVQPLSRNLVGFDDYFKTLTLAHSDLNPWFNESLIEYCRKQGSHRRSSSIRVRNTKFKVTIKQITLALIQPLWLR